MKIYLRTGHANEALNLLQSDRLGLTSSIGQLDPRLCLSLALETMAAAELHEELFTLCSGLLMDPRYQQFDCINDDRVWKTLFDSYDQNPDSRFVVRLALRDSD